MELKVLYMLYASCFSWDPLRIIFEIISFVLDALVIQNDMSLVSEWPDH